MNMILKKVSRLDKAVEKIFKAGKFSFPPEVDLFFKWLPVLYVLMADATGVKTKSRFMQRVLLIAVSEIILNSFVQPLKKVIDRKRPGSLFKFNSFPSGHTATSFCGAEILREEIKEHSVALSLAGYASAMITASLRLYKKKHWFSDIVAAALIGIVSARITYALYKGVRNERGRT